MRTAFWEGVLASDMAVPDDQPLNDLTAELVSMLGSADPFERDAVAYPVLATWVEHGVYDDLLMTFGQGITAGFTAGLGHSGDDSVFRRTFSALVLGECISRDNVAHLLTVDTVLRWADAGVTWLVHEQDLRPFVEGKGWAHAPAHGSDLLAALARSRHFRPTELAVLLDVVADRVTAPTEVWFTHGEDDRLAYAVMTVLHRNVLAQDLLDGWVARLAETALTQPGPGHGPDRPWPPASVHNTRSLLRVLYLQLALGVRGYGESDAAFYAGHPDVRADLLLTLNDVLAKLLPYANRPE